MRARRRGALRPSPPVIRTMRGSCPVESFRIQSKRKRVGMMVFAVTEEVASFITRRTISASTATRRDYPLIRRLNPNGVIVLNSTRDEGFIADDRVRWNLRATRAQSTPHARVRPRRSSRSALRSVVDGGAVWSSVGFIIRRSRVQMPSPPSTPKGRLRAVAVCSWGSKGRRPRCRLVQRSSFLRVT